MMPHLARTPVLPVPRRPGQGGAALVTTVIILVVLTFLVVGFLSTMLVERQAASAYENSQQAKFVAQGAISHAIDLLRTNIPEPARLAEGPRNAPAENWVSNPGRLTVIEGSGSPRTVALHTGEVTTAPDPGQPRDAESVDLNQPIPGQTAGAITGTLGVAGNPAPPMRVRWVNLLADPTRGAGADNRLSARYAFWMDDEATRLNFNAAGGKPAPAADAQYAREVNEGYLTPTFKRGAAQRRPWALGRPQSVNLDALFASPDHLKTDALLDHVFTSGFLRHPEAILDFVDRAAIPNPLEWYEAQKFNLTAYSRSPEFNAFGRPRLVTTYVPLSLESGSSYQHPFIHDPTGAYVGDTNREVLHLNSLLGTFGFTAALQDEDGDMLLGGNVVNRGQIEMLTDYLRRVWPGQTRSFFDKYGEAECRQIALNAALYARMATTQISNNNLKAFTTGYIARTTSVNYSPTESEIALERVPERMYWRFRIGNETKLMLPQMPGPYITEVVLHVRAIPPSPAPSDPTRLRGFILPRYLEYWYETEYYMPPFGPEVDLNYLPTRMDYLDLEVSGRHGTVTQVFDAANWNNARALRELQAPPFDERTEETPANPIGPRGRVVVRSQRVVVGEVLDQVPRPGTNAWRPKVFEGANGAVTVNFRLRPGMGVGLKNGPRPRQMIPLGETPNETLKASFSLNLLQTNREQAVSWQIADPRLSGNLAAWEEALQGPGPAADIGTLALPNANEPAEDGPEASKNRYLMRSRNPDHDRGNEYDVRYNTNAAAPTTLPSRISSPGYWSLLHTGMQANIPWRTVNLKGGQQEPPDWLLLDLFAPTFPMSTDQWRQDGGKRPDEFSTITFMNSTAGQVNLNSRIYPRNEYFQPPERTKPLEAVFTNIPGVDGSAVASILSSYQRDTRFFDYVGRAADAGLPGGPGRGDWSAEFLLRNLSGLLTTRSNTFGVWGVAQVVKKLRDNGVHDRFERGDRVVGEKRFYAVIERYLWMGRDGVPGNAHAHPKTGRWDRLASQAAKITTGEGATDTLFQLPGSPPLRRAGNQERLDLDSNGSYAPYDGPEQVGMNASTATALGRVSWTESSLEEAYNPPQPVVKYRVVYFKYLDQ